MSASGKGIVIFLRQVCISFTDQSKVVKYYLVTRKPFMDTVF